MNSNYVNYDDSVNLLFLQAAVPIDVCVIFEFPGDDSS